MMKVLYYDAHCVLIALKDRLIEELEKMIKLEVIEGTTIIPIRLIRLS